MRIDSYVITITAAATPQNLIAAASGTLPQYRYAKDIMIRCPSANTSDLKLGSPDRQAFTILKGTSMALSEILRTGQATKYELAAIFLKAGTNGDTAEICIVDPSND